jgi:hypothetical protein
MGRIIPYIMEKNVPDHQPGCLPMDIMIVMDSSNIYIYCNGKLPIKNHGLPWFTY